MKTTAEVIACTIAQLRQKADDCERDARHAIGEAERSHTHALDLTEQAHALRDAANVLEAATHTS